MKTAIHGRKFAMNDILLFFDCSQDTQYAIPTLEQRFQPISERLAADQDKIHSFYVEVSKGASDAPGAGRHRNFIGFDPTTGSRAALERL